MDINKYDYLKKIVEEANGTSAKSIDKENNSSSAENEKHQKGRDGSEEYAEEENRDPVGAAKSLAARVKERRIRREIGIRKGKGKRRRGIKVVAGEESIEENDINHTNANVDALTNAVKVDGEEQPMKQSDVDYAEA
ncbi:hypothetical protein FXO38_36251, partial [Capsicum annuum]